MRRSYIYNTVTEYKYYTPIKHKYCSGFRLMCEVVRHNNRCNNTTLIIISRG